jgi:cystathionine beta-lyase family protein involved in aluminum resistance
MAGKRNTNMLPAGYRNDPLLQLHRAIEEHLDALYAVITDSSSFVEVRIKDRGDGTSYALVKRLEADGTPVVAFGSGYDPLSALAGLEGAVHAGNWRADKPYRIDGKGGD